MRSLSTKNSSSTPQVRGQCQPNQYISYLCAKLTRCLLFAQPLSAAGGGAGVWDETVWRAKLDRYAALGAELVASGADTCESKVRHPLYRHV